MKKNCKYFRYAHKLYFLEIKEVLVLFDKISSFRLREDSDSTAKSFIYCYWVFLPCFWCPIYLLDSTINVKYMASTSSLYIHAKIVHIRACARYKSNPIATCIHSYSNIILCAPVGIFFRMDFHVFLDVTQHL